MIWEDFVILTTQQTVEQLMNTDFCSNTELLQYVADNGIIDLGTSFQIDSIGYYTLYNEGQSIIFVRKQAKGNALCYGPLTGPYQTIYQSSVKNEPVSFNLNANQMIGGFSIKHSLW